jgi:hypothetical protein
MGNLDSDSLLGQMFERDRDVPPDASADVVESTGRQVVTQPVDWTVRNIFDMEQEGALYLRPDFQRKSVWDDGRQTRLIESLLLSIPLPIVYIAEESNGNYSVIDGQQRLTSIVRYLKNEYALKGLGVMTELTNKKFQNLDKRHQQAVKNSIIRGIIIKKESDPNVKFEVFERLNTGAVPLNAQEIRNCVYRGPFNELLKELETYPDWLRLIRLQEPDSRMWDREMILRFFALHDRYNDYGSSMKRFLNDEMEGQRFCSAEHLQICRALFKKVVRMSLSVFGDHAFERFSVGDEKDSNGNWEGKINYALFDVVMFAFAQYEERDIVPRGDAVREALIDLMVREKSFENAISYSTATKTAVRSRITLWENRLRTVVGFSAPELRVYSYAFRKQLYDQNPVCGLCDGKIVVFDDATVDHVQPWSLGGATEPSNARLAHRYCNIARGNRPFPS